MANPAGIETLRTRSVVMGTASRGWDFKLTY